MIGKLYTFRRCPYAMRARLALKLANLDYKAIEVDLKDKPQDMLDYSPKGTVPVLVLNSNQIIDESLDIIDWVIEQYPKGWKQLSDNELEEGKVLLSSLTSQFIPALNHYKYASRYEDVDLEKEEGTILSYLKRLNESMHILSKEPCKYSIAIFPFVRQANIANDQWLMLDVYQDLNDWFHFWLESDVFIDIMKK